MLFFPRRLPCCLTATIAMCLGAINCGCAARDASPSLEDHDHVEHGDDHDHLHDHDHATPEHRPGDFGEAVARIGQLHADVIAELDEGHAEHAHGAMHVMLDIARWLPEIAADSNMPEEQWNAVSADAVTLGKIYAALDEALHRDATRIDRGALREVPDIVARLQRIADDGAWNSDEYQHDDQQVADTHN